MHHIKKPDVSDGRSELIDWKIKEPPATINCEGFNFSPLHAIKNELPAIQKMAIPSSVYIDIPINDPLTV
jgi:hypothetical protein